MFCGKCGAENRDGARFCKSCGQPLMSNMNNGQGINPQPQFQSQPQPQQYSYGNYTGNGYNSNMNQGVKKNPSQLISKLKRIPIGAYIGGGAGVVSLIVVIAFLVISGKTIDLNRYLKIEASGYSGYGTATVSIDWETLKREHGSDLSFTSVARQQYIGASKTITPADIARNYISVVLDKNSKLSNGDTINYEWKIDEKLSRYIDGRITCSGGAFAVSDLKSVSTFDAFEKVEIHYSGTDPYGMVASIDYKGDEFPQYTFKCDKVSGLKNGDIIKVSMYGVDMDAFVKKYGKLPETTTKEYTVSGLQEYIDSCSEVSDEFLARLKTESEDVIYSYVANSYSKSSALANLEYVGFYIIRNTTSGSFFGINNYLYIVYSGDVSNSEGKFDTTKVYFPVCFSDILLQSDGSYKYNNYKTIVGNSNLSGSTYSTKGYTDGADMYNSIITENRSDYRHDVSEGLKQFGD